MLVYCLLSMNYIKSKSTNLIAVLWSQVSCFVTVLKIKECGIAFISINEYNVLLRFCLSTSKIGLLPYIYWENLWNYFGQ